MSITPPKGQNVNLTYCGRVRLGSGGGVAGAIIDPLRQTYKISYNYSTHKHTSGGEASLYQLCQTSILNLMFAN